MRMQRLAGNTQLVLMGLLLLLACGCGGSTSDGYTGERGKVSGTITIGDKPIPQGSQVLFMAKSGGYTGVGTVDSRGIYSLTSKDPKGLPIGIYSVQLAPPTAPITAQSADPSAMAQQLKLGPSGPGGANAAPPFPTKYLSAATSELSFTVKAESNTIDIQLKPE